MSCVGQIVDGDEVEVGVGLVGGPEEVAADPPEPVDADLDCHLFLLVDEQWMSAPRSIAAAV